MTTNPCARYIYICIFFFSDAWGAADFRHIQEKRSQLNRGCYTSVSALTGSALPTFALCRCQRPGGAWHLSGQATRTPHLNYQHWNASLNKPLTYRYCMQTHYSSFKNFSKLFLKKQPSPPAFPRVFVSTKKGLYSLNKLCIASSSSSPSWYLQSECWYLESHCCSLVLPVWALSS